MLRSCYRLNTSHLTTWTCQSPETSSYWTCFLGFLLLRKPRIVYQIRYWQLSHTITKHITVYSTLQVSATRGHHRALHKPKNEGKLKVIKVKVTLVQAQRLCTGHTAHRGTTGLAVLFLDRGTKRGWVVSFTPRLLFTPGKDSIPII